ncbi:endothelin-converting enzyme 1-like isoform X2 [Watersipora subatra]|uniref:endothelin-converting enzyme 1-like isoform X2 n=1 Tax=Watersipora subatra TaxID=2589382 RepID=UPI00355BB91C
MTTQFHRLDVDDAEVEVDFPPPNPQETDIGYLKRRSRCYLIVILFLTALVIALSITVISLEVRKGKVEKITTVAPSLPDGLICTTDNCIVAAGEVIAQMNQSVDPCVDFYNYACGSFIANGFLPPAETKYSQFSIMTDENIKLLHQELTSDKITIFGQTSSALVKLKTLNRQCMDVSQLQKEGSKPLVKAIADFGSWSMTNDSFDISAWNFTDQLLRLHRYGFSPLFFLSVDVDDKNNTFNTLKIFQNGITLSSEKDYNLTDVFNYRVRDAFINYGVEIARLLGTEESKARPIMEEIFILESELASLYVPSKILRDPQISYNKLSMSDLKSMFGDALDIENFLYAVLDRSDIGNNNQLICSSKPYFDKLKEKVLDKYLSANRTLNRVMNNYLIWYMVHRTIDNLDTDFQFAQLIITQVTQGVTGVDERWKTCTKKMDDEMGRATGAAYIEGRFNEEDKDIVTDIVTSVRNTLLENFSGYAWMDEPTRQAAIIKARAIDIRIGYPDYITTAKQVDEYYEKFEVGDTYFDSLMRHRRWVRVTTAAHLDMPPDPTEWEMSAAEVNAYYHPVYNKVVLPAGILQRPFYDANLPLAWNYGGMGSVIGHEITHGFDDKGSRYDANGNLVNWWTNYSQASFDVRRDCFVYQYSKYDVAGTQLDGLLNLGENIADNGGVPVAYKAYLQKIEDSGEKPMTLPGLGLNDDQLFFLSFAQMWCSKSTPEIDQTSLAYNLHSPSKYRVQGTFSNNAAFSEAFKCAPGSPYNPKIKCKIW